MIAHNLCFSTFVMKEKYDNIKDVKYLHKKWEAGDYKFAQNVEGLLPKMLKKLWAARKVAKKQMKNAPTPELTAVYNGKQLAIKVSMNSIYGFTGASTGMLPCKPIVMSWFDTFILSYLNSITFVVSYKIASKELRLLFLYSLTLYHPATQYLEPVSP